MNPSLGDAMTDTNSLPFQVTALLPLIPVRDLAVAAEFYNNWIGRSADLEPDAGLAEWELAKGMWLQVAEKPETAGTSVVRLGVEDTIKARESLIERGVEVDEIQEFGGFVRIADFRDPDGNRFTLVQDLM
jgi:predicted enzyme related to lactoylglutathione lyase